MTIRIVYYSRKGHTQNVATVLATLLDAELIRIEPVSEGGIAGTQSRLF
ncbi:MAG: hypothetical protein LUQ31_08850 [Methanoregula sp.]|nr:hypothetical protein [Methanoregula sp.]